MENSERPAFVTDNLPVNPNFTGLTKMELISAMAMQGILASGKPWEHNMSDELVVKESILIAYTLLKQLDNEK